MKEWIGRTVHVVVDRPLGSHHPEDPGLAYELNYGYIPGTTAPDGEPIDVYVIDVDEPISECDAEVIAVIRRRDDVEDKLVARVGEEEFSADEVGAMTAFQERWFDTVVEMGDGA